MSKHNILKISRTLIALVSAALIATSTLAIVRAAAPEPAFLVKDIAPGFPYTPQYLQAAGGRVYFYVNSKLWLSDGTDSGTVEATFSPNVTNPTVIGEFNGRALIIADITLSNKALFISDGTAAGLTPLVENITLSMGPGPLLGQTSSHALFALRNATGGTDLWRTDGTAIGTVAVKTIRPTGDAFPSTGITIGATTYFVADDGTHGPEIWKSDGTAAGTSLLKDINPTTTFTAPTTGFLTPLGSKFVFAADDGVNGNELWISDGTENGTTLLKDLNPGPAGSISNPPSTPRGFPIVAGKPLIVLGGDFSPRVFWTTDGTPEGTQSFYTITNVNFFSGPVSTGAFAFFTRQAPDTGVELWRTDGTTEGTQLVKDIIPGVAGSEPNELRNIDGALVFAASGDGVSKEVWRSDGTEAGTTLVADVNVGYDSSLPREFTAAGDFVFFTAEDGTHGRDLWAMPRALFEKNTAYLPLIQAP